MGFVLVLFLIAGAISLFIAMPGYKYMMRRQVKGAILWSALIFVASFCAISAGVIYAISISFRR